MYQNEMKEGFIKDYMRSRVVAQTSLYSLFRKTEVFEEKHNKDCSHFTEKEILDMYTDFGAKSVYVLLNYNTILKAYCAWKKYYHKENIDHAYEHIDIDKLRVCVPKNKHQFLSRQEVIDIEDQLYNFTDKAIIECLFEGISGPSMIDLTSLDANMIDHKTKELYLPDKRIVQLTDRLYDLLMKAFDEKEYLCYGATLRIKKLFGTGRLYKEMDNAYAKDSKDKAFRWVYRRFQNFRNQIGTTELTMKNIQTSGFYHYLCIGLSETNLDLKRFLQTERGAHLAEKYGYTSVYRVDNLTHMFKQFV